MYFALTYILLCHLLTLCLVCLISMLQDKLRAAYALPKDVDEVELEQCHTLKKAGDELAVVKHKLAEDNNQDTSETNSLSCEDIKGIVL